ncbi:MAG: hypothetical protein CME65_08300 [Halobacteriovoraceae bacterium]|nr:hypothetical protein [Halobacteriovoraceae bacterium]|tara:strand:- start:4583 stop:5602 length:1020 start_codon:yes stop_codon:yes gene_type:complete
MNKLKVRIMPLSDRQFLVSFTHPLTKKTERRRFLTRLEADEYRKKVEYQFRQKRVESYHSLSVEELICLNISENPASPFNRKKTHLIDFTETFGDFLIDDLTTPMLKSWLNQIKLENNLKDISVRGIKCEVDTFFAYLVKKEIISESPLSRIYYKKQVPSLKARNLLSPNEIQELLAALHEYSPGYLYPIIKIFTETAAKTSEVVELKWRDINLDLGTVTFGGGQKSQKRVLKLSLELVDILSKKANKKGNVFMTYHKEPFTSKKLTLAINEFKRMNLYKGPWCPMDLRHSFAVNFLSQGGEIRKLQELLGHDNVYDTKRLYGESIKKQISTKAKCPFE